MAVKTEKVDVKVRFERGSRAIRRLRLGQMLPGIVYGHKQDPVAVSLPSGQVANSLKRGAHVFELSIDGRAETCLVKEVQYDHLGQEILHVDFARVSLDERVEISVPLELKGTPKGEADGGVLQQIIANLQVECLVLDIPEIIRHNVSEMKLDDVLHIRDLQLPHGVKCLQDGELIVATVKEVLEVLPTAEAAEAAPAEPELIGRKPSEEEAAEGEAGAAPAKGAAKGEKKE